MPAETAETTSSAQPQTAAKPRGPQTHTLVEPPNNSGAGRRIVFDQSEQRVWLVVSNETAVRTYLVTGSNRDNVQPGSYVVTSRSRHAQTYNRNGTFEYFVRFTEGRKASIGFHAVTVDKQGQPVHARADLGVPRTPGCIEQWHDDAKALWAFAPLGTRIIVIP